MCLSSLERRQIKHIDDRFSKYKTHKTSGKNKRNFAIWPFFFPNKKQIKDRQREAGV